MGRVLYSCCSFSGTPVGPDEGEGEEERAGEQGGEKPEGRAEADGGGEGGGAGQAEENGVELARVGAGGAGGEEDQGVELGEGGGKAQEEDHGVELGVLAVGARGGEGGAASPDEESSRGLSTGSRGQESERLSKSLRLEKAARAQESSTAAELTVTQVSVGHVTTPRTTTHSTHPTPPHPCTFRQAVVKAGTDYAKMMMKASARRKWARPAQQPPPSGGGTRARLGRPAGAPPRATEHPPTINQAPRTTEPPGWRGGGTALPPASNAKDELTVTQVGRLVHATAA